MDRRQFLGGASAAFLASPALAKRAAGVANAAPTVELTTLESATPNSNRVWLGPDFWANRLQDWAREGSAIICQASASDLQVRTAHILTRRIESGFSSARVRLTTRSMTQSAKGFGGLLIGAGGDDLDYRGAALIQRFSGKNGGVLAVVDENGAPSFRAFDQPADTLDFALFGTTEANVGALPSGSSLHFDLEIFARTAEKCDLRLIVTDAATGQETGCAVLPELETQRVLGNIALVSSPVAQEGEEGARWAFRDIAMGGGVSVYPERAFGPVMACLHSLNRNVLKLTAQLMPVSPEDIGMVRFDYCSGGSWITGPTEPVGGGFAALFRIENWNAAVDHAYRIVDPANPEIPLYEGAIRADPGNARALSIALHSCLLPTARSLDEANYKPRIPQETPFGRYSPDNILFPHDEMVERCEAQKPDLYVFCGDQYYETYPTRLGRKSPDVLLDTLYRWYLFLWTFREPLRDRPAIVLADDHDVLQGNLWGNEGEGSDLPREEDGGFKHDKHMVRTVYRVQTGHNPDPWDDTPITDGIPVSFGHFVYGATSFAFVEDRKFKDPPNTDIAPEKTRGELLGERQEAFLEAWADMDPGLPKVCLTASIWGSPQTAGNLEPLLDYDSNGYPPDGRNRAVKLLRDAGAVALAGDQHLAMLAVQGIDAPDDGPLFFAGPAGAAFWQRWFEGQGKLANKRDGDPNSGDFVDCFGHPMRVLAVANPRIDHDTFMASKDFWGNFVGDHRLKSEGFGIVRVDHADAEFIFECWPRSADERGYSQFAGWPYRHPFTDGL